MHDGIEAAEDLDRLTGNEARAFGEARSARISLAGDVSSG